MKTEKIVVGQSYETKIGQEWTLVKVIERKRDYFNSNGMPSTEFIVQTPKGNRIYRVNQQLRIKKS